MRLRRESVSTVVHALQVLFLHVQFASCALPASLQSGDNGLHRDNVHEAQRGSSSVTTASSSSSSSNSGGIISREPSSSSSSTSSQRHHPAHSAHHKPYWNHDTPDPSGSQSREHRWATAAFNFVHNLDCEDVFFTTSRECHALVEIPRYEMNVHLAGPSPYGKFRTTIPEEPLTGSGLQEAVLVVDPYPRANFGHLLVVFFIDSRVSRGHCQKMGGLYLGRFSACCLSRSHC